MAAGPPKPAAPTATSTPASQQLRRVELRVSTDLPVGVAGSPYAGSFGVARGKPPYRWSIVSGELPGGLDFDPASGTIAGRPATYGVFNLAVSVSDSSSLQASAIAGATLTVSPKSVSITTAALTSGRVGTWYNEVLTAAGGAPPYGWQVVSGSLPEGLTLDPASGAITGNIFSSETTTVTVSVTDSWTPAMSSTQTFKIRVVGAREPQIAGARAPQVVDRRDPQPKMRHLVTPPIAAPGAPSARVKNYKLDDTVARLKDENPLHTSSVIVTLVPGAQLPPELKQFARANGKLDIINGQVLNLPNGVIRQLEANPNIFRVHDNRPILKFNYRTSLTTGTRAVHQGLGLTGAGIGVAVIDSGIGSWHDDLTNQSSTLYPYGNQRVAKFVDFVDGSTTPRDGDGHGTHVAGIIAGNGYDSNGQKTGAAPDASLAVLRVLDADGNGTIGYILSALDWVLSNHTAYNIRVVNMSVGAAINESYWTDPLTLATKRVVDAGIVVVVAAGNRGRNAAGQPQYGSITAPANAPWVLTVGGSSTNGTPDRSDDTIASFSSRGPTFIDFAAKPDLVAPGAGSVSLADPISHFYTSKASSLLPGSVATAALPYLSLSGTSMATPVVSGTIALMLQANPSLTPNAVKAILQYTAQAYPGYDDLTQGAGFLNAVGAVRLAQFLATAQPGDPYPTQSMWSKRVIWGNHELLGGELQATANAWSVGTTWGVAKTDAGDNIVWGTAADGDNIVWGTDCGGADCDNVVWGTADSDNIVWGTAADGDNIVWGTAGDDNIVWGTAGDDNIVWGTSSNTNLTWASSADGTPILVGSLNDLTDEQIFAMLGQVPLQSSPPPEPTADPAPAPTADPAPASTADPAPAPTADPAPAPVADPAPAPTADPAPAPTADPAPAPTADPAPAPTADPAPAPTANPAPAPVPDGGA